MNKKKIMSLIMALVMLVGVFSPLSAFADTTNEPVGVPTGTLEKSQLSATKPPKTEIELYKLTTKESYKAGAPWEHTGGKIADTTTLGTSVEPLKGAKFTFYKIKGTDDKESEKILALLDKNKANFETVEDMTNLIKDGKTGLKASDRDANFTSIGKNKLEKVTAADSEGLTNGETAETDTNGKVTVKLADGYYWAIESHKPDKVTGQIAVPFGLTLPLMNGKDVGDIKAGTQYLKKLYIYPKNIQTNDVKIDKNHADYNTTDKKWYDKDGNEVTSADLGAEYEKYEADKKAISAQLGEDRRFDSKTEIPRNYTFTEFSWSDIMSEGLTYNKGTLKVTMDYTDADGQKQTNKTFIDLTADPKVNNSLVSEKNNGFDITVTKPTKTETNTDTEKAILDLVDYLKNGPVTFHFAYSAKVNNNTVVDKPQSNSITFEPGKPDGGGKVKSKDKKISIEKSWINKDEKNKNNTAKDITYYLLDAEGKTVASVTVKAGTEAGKKYDAGKGITFTVGNKLGSGTFEGLEDGKEFTVREAVAGYKPTYNNGAATTPEGTLAIENNEKPEVKKPTEPKIVFHGKKFVKMDQLGNETRLFGAEFVVKNKSTDTKNQDKDKFLVIKSAAKRVEEIDAVKNAKAALDKKIDKYNNLNAEQQKAQKATYDTAIDNLQKTYNDAVIAARTEYTWVEGTGTGNNTPPENAYKLVSDGQGRFEITGLSAGDYELVEVKAPAGYAISKTNIPFKVNDGTYAGTNKEVQYNKDNTDGGYGQRVDNKKVTIPQTGGMGTVLFTVVGISLMAGAVIAMKKNREEA